MLAAIDPSAGRELSQEIRASFKPGDEQGKERRLRAVGALEGEGALDLITAVLEDAVEVGGVYSNLRNAALPIMAERFPAHPQLAAPLWRAIEVDPYLNVLFLYGVVAPYIAAVRSLRFVSAEEVFARVSALFTAPDRTSPVARDRLSTVLWSATPMESPRWLEFLTGRLAVEAHPKVRALLVSALSPLGPPAVEAIIAAATDDAEGTAAAGALAGAADAATLTTAPRGTPLAIDGAQRGPPSRGRAKEPPPCPCPPP